MQYLEQVAVPLRAAGHRTELRVAAGHPADVIARVAADLGPGLVVMATHGRGMLSRLVLESVASEVLRRLTVPVLLVRPNETRMVAEPVHAPVEDVGARALRLPASV